MKTTIKRFKVKSEAEAIQYVQNLRRNHDRMATVEKDGDQYYLCVPMEVRTVRYDQIIAAYRFN